MQEGAILNNRYKLLERLGAGGMAIVYRAHDLMLERDVAIKLLRENYSDNTSFQGRFRQEARAAANLSHPNIVTVHDFGLEKGLLYIVMEYIPGTDLKSMIKQRGRFSIPEAIPLIVQACAGIGYAHRAGLVHCDIKPQNMLVTPDQRLKVTDFGIARALATINPEEHNEVVWGSPQYFSPEQASGDPPSPASDVYSLGIVLYEMLTGSLPFVATTVEALSHMHRNTNPVPIREYLPEIPQALDQIVMKVLSKEPSARYRTADQLGRVLMKFGTETDTPSALSLTPEAAPAYQSAAPVSSQTATNHRQEPVSQPRPPISTAATTRGFTQPENDEEMSIDWITIGLGLLALCAVGGLIILGILVYIAYNPPI